MYQDGLKVFNYTYGDEKEFPLLPTTFHKIQIAANMRGRFTDFQVYRKYFNEDDMVTWTTGCPGTKGDIFNWDRTKLNISGTTEKNVTIMRMDLSEVCPDSSKPVKMQLPKISASGNGRRRFQPPRRNRTSYTDSVLELITDRDFKTSDDVQCRCFRLNGELMTLPQNKGDEDLMNNVLWNYEMKKNSNDEDKTIEGASTRAFIGAMTKKNEAEDVSRSRQQTYPPEGKLDLLQPWTGESLHDYRGDLVLPQLMTY